MITDSHIGASSIVLFIDFIYVFRGRDKSTSMSIGLLSFAVTTITYLFGLFIGIVWLSMGGLDQVQIQDEFTNRCALRADNFILRGILTELGIISD